ncbi:hypothetical protein SAMN04489798_3332 [Pseudomonas arsenicoxydans]|uniref:Uncharacterized protein n=1 Tax=Pseudomonas arsenicoxydans TaxID=702115 RepID=A0A1H0KS33_9PSED|nr:hypothetical protein SAMN04489798_3332 [Pseudomonas arsenicoxydans]
MQAASERNLADGDISYLVDLVSQIVRTDFDYQTTIPV